MSELKQKLFSKEPPSGEDYRMARTFWRTMMLVTPFAFLFSGAYWIRYDAKVPALMIFCLALVVFGVNLWIKTFPHFANKYSTHVGIFLYANLFFGISLYTGGPLGNGPFWILSTIIVALNFVNKKEIAFWSLYCGTLVGILFLPQMKDVITMVVTEEQAFGYRLSSQITMAIVISFIAYTSLSNREKALQEKEDAIKAANQTSNLASLGEMAGGIAHEINNPLMIISGSAMVIDKHLGKDDLDIEKMKKHIATINKTTKRAANIIKGLKNLARDGINDEKEDVTISSVLEDIMSFMENKMAHSNIQLHYEENTPMFNKTFSLYRVQFSQVLLNLITNSFYAVEELEEKWIRIEMEEKGSQYLVRVTDSGSGIPQEHQEKIFTPFFTTKPVGKGTGLGLPLCHNIMKTCGGDLYYDNKAKNTSFVIVLPPQDFIKDYKVEAA